VCQEHFLEQQSLVSQDSIEVTSNTNKQDELISEVTDVSGTLHLTQGGQNSNTLGCNLGSEFGR
jgi:hypothetical protein